MNHVLCDGGLCNRLNALLFALVLRRRHGGAWRISWPVNNWCGARFDELFRCDLPHDDHGIGHYVARQHQVRPVMHENLVGFDPARFVDARTFTGWADWDGLITRDTRDTRDAGDAGDAGDVSTDGIVYSNSLLPSFVGVDELRAALADLQVAPGVAARARAFVREHRIDAGVTGLHIRKTDFGDRVDDAAWLAQVQAAADRCFFVCSDDAEVNRRFAALPNCAVFAKTAFPEKMDGDATWQAWTQDGEGRRFPFNIRRGAASVVEALVDLLVLSRTTPLPTSSSTFLATARLFGACGFFPTEASTEPSTEPSPEGAAAMNAPLEARQFAAPAEPKFDLSLVDEAEHLIPRPFGTLQSLNLDHLYRYAFAKGLCYGADVLDAAMGCGYSSLLLNCRSYTGVDIDANMVAFAREQYLPMTKTGRYLQGSVLELPVPDASIDTYISFETIEHIQPGEVARYFAEVKRVLRPGGRFVCSTPVYRGDRFGLLTKYHPFEFRYLQFESTLVASGFVLTEVLYQHPPHFTLEHVVPSFAQTQQAAPYLTVCVAQLPR